MHRWITPDVGGCCPRWSARGSCCWSWRVRALPSWPMQVTMRAQRCSPDSAGSACSRCSWRRSGAGPGPPPAPSPPCWRRTCRRWSGSWAVHHGAADNDLSGQPRQFIHVEPHTPTELWPVEGTRVIVEVAQGPPAQGERAVEPGRRAPRRPGRPRPGDPAPVGARRPRAAWAAEPRGRALSLPDRAVPGGVAAPLVPLVPRAGGEPGGGGPDHGRLPGPDRSVDPRPGQGFPSPSWSGRSSGSPRCPGGA